MYQLRLPEMRLQGLAFLLVACSALACGTAATDSTGSGTGGRGGSGGSGGTTGGSGGSSGGDAAACPKFNYTNYNPTMSPTLRNDLQPIFNRGCALASSCHQLGGSHHPFLGLSIFQIDGGLTNAMLETVLSEVKDKPSTQVAGRSLVVPGKPEESYLMNKVEGTHDCSGFVCMGPDKCGLQMPGPPPDADLEPFEVELIRAWIKKGAPL